MKITTIYGEGIRGQSFNLKLTGRDIILGPNGIGKTTRLDAIPLAWQGYLQRYGLQLVALLPLFAGERMAAGFRVQNGGEEPVLDVLRTFTRVEKDDGTYKVDQRLTLKGAQKAKGGIREAEATIRATLGHVPAAFDLSELMSLTSGEQRKYLFRYSDPDAHGLNRTTAVEKIRRAVVTADVLVNQDRKTRAELWIRLLDKAWGDCPDVGEALTRVTKWAAEALRTAKASLEAAEALKVSSGTATIDAGTEGDPITTREEIAKLRGQLRAIQDHIAADGARRASVKERTAKIQKLTGQVAFLRLPGDDEKTEAVDLQRARCQELLGAAASGTQEEFEAAQVTRDEAMTAETRAWERMMSARATNTDRQALRDRVAKLAGACCDSCGRDLSPEDAAAFLGRLDDELAASCERCATLEQEHEAATRLKEEAQSKVSDLLRGRQESETYRASIADCERRLERCKLATEARERRLAEVTAELQALQHEDVSATLTDTTTMDREAEVLEGQIDSLEKRLQAEQTAETMRETQLKAARDRLLAAIDVELLKAIQTAVGPSGIQGQVAAKLAEPITAAGSRLVASCFPLEERRFGVRLIDDRGADDFDVGWYVGGKWRGWLAVSTGEKAILSATLVHSILDVSAPPLRVLLIDCIEALDPAEPLLQALLDMPKLDNVILAGVRVHGDIPDGWTVHRPEAGEVTC